MSYYCPSCKSETSKVPNEYVNFKCTKCPKKWTIVDLENIPRELINKLTKNTEFCNQVMDMGKHFERSSV